MVVLINVGGLIGAIPTISLVVLTAAIGVTLLRRQGLSTLTRARSKLDRGAIPASEMVEGIFLAVGGALLLTPGFITDAIGFFCLLPGVRHIIIAWGARHILARGATFGQASTHSSFHSSARTNTASSSSSAEKRTIEGEFKRED